MKKDKLKKEKLEEFEKEFGIHFKGSSGELQFAKDFISDIIDCVRRGERIKIKKEINELTSIGGGKYSFIEKSEVLELIMEKNPLCNHRCVKFE